jgi:hypothetical protein
VLHSLFKGKAVIRFTEASFVLLKQVEIFLDELSIMQREVQSYLILALELGGD